MEESELVETCIAKYVVESGKSLPGIELESSLLANVNEYLRLKEEKARISKEEKKLNEAMKQSIIPVLEALGKNCNGYISSDSGLYEISYAPSGRVSIAKENLEKLKCQYPDIYEEYATASNTRSFSVKLTEAQEAAA